MEWKNSTFHLCVSLTKKTYSVNQHALVVFKIVDSFVGDGYVDEQPLRLGTNHRKSPISAP